MIYISTISKEEMPLQYDRTQMGHVIRAGREAKGMTQAALAEKTRTVPRTIIAIEKGKRYPTYEVFHKIVNVLELSADHVFWPERAACTPAQEQVIREFLSCTKEEQEVVANTMRTLVRSLREKNNP